MTAFQAGVLGDELIRALLAVASVAAIVLGGELFTTGTEWLAERFGLSESTTGSLVAALATTLPETLIPLLAILEGRGASVGVGAIVGGPVSLTTFALGVLGVTALAAAARGTREPAVSVDTDQPLLDLGVFLAGFSLALAAGFLRGGWTRLLGVPLVVLYAWYLPRVVGSEDERSESSNRNGEDSGFDPEPLELGRVRDLLDPVLGAGGGDHRTDPSRSLVVIQVLLAAGLLLGGAHLFVESVTWLAEAVFSVPEIVVALLLAPLISNVPENVDGVIWVGEGEDVLAVEQVTGTLAFQGTVVTALGVVFTPWNLSAAWGTAGFLVATAGALALLSAGYAYHRLSDGAGTLGPRPLVGLGLVYAAFVAVIAYYAVAGYI